MLTYTPSPITMWSNSVSPRSLAPHLHLLGDGPVLRAYARISGGVIVNQDEPSGVG